MPERFECTTVAKKAPYKYSSCPFLVLYCDAAYDNTSSCVVELLTVRCTLSVCRMESVVEKLLSNWLSLCMYDYLRHETPGQALYTLYQAVRCQTDKGAVDAITGEAKYSLNDARLLRENIEPKQLVKARFHYASWFGAGSEPVSVIEFGR